MVSTLLPTSADIPTSIQNAGHRSLVVKHAAGELGFDACGIAAAQPPDPGNRLGHWLNSGFQADMAWIDATRALRQDVSLKLPGVRSVVVVAQSYYQESTEPPGPPHGRVARYAWGRDYHNALKKPVRRLAQAMAALEEGAACWSSIDSGPMLERGWAALAGLGWVGKNSLILRQDMGSWFFLAAVATTVELAPDAPVLNHCGSCTACLDACPTGAIVEEGVVDSNRCISYHTIENRHDIPPAVADHMGDWVFGCDICQEVCPWNRFAQPTRLADFAARAGQSFPLLEELLGMDEGSFNSKFEGSPLRRAKHAGMQRNARIARQNRAAENIEESPLGRGR